LPRGPCTELPRLIDPQVVRFAGARFLQVPNLAELDYAPVKPITPDEMNVTDAPRAGPQRAILPD
jgi:hypothetical protein